MKNVILTSIRRRVTVAMFTLAVLLFGFVSFSRLKINLLPELTYPTLTIRTEYPGTAPAEIENLITKPLEEAAGVVKNVQKVSSISRSGQSDVILEFAWGTDMDYSTLDVREKIDAVELPLEASSPIIMRFDPSLDPVMRFGFFQTSTEEQDFSGSDEERMKFLRRFADEQIKKELESALGVAAVKISGGLEDEIQVLIDQEKLAALNLSIDQVSAVLNAENVNLSGGRLKEGTQQFLIRTLNQFQSLEQIGDVIIAYRNGIPIHLRDIGDIRFGFKERKAVTRINGLEAVEIAVYKEGDANTVAVAREVSEKLAEVENILPPGYHLRKVYDQAVFIRNAVNEVIQAGLIGGILAIIILYFFLRNFWATVIISLSIPISVIATFNLMYGADLSLNIMSLGGIALGIGMLLDNSIVVLENIFRHRDLGKDVVNAARDGAVEVGTAVTASTLTTIAVFFPLVFVKGIAGQLFRDQALTITFSLMVSLLVAMTLIPMLASTQRGGGHDEPLPGSRKANSKAARAAHAVRNFFFYSIPVFAVKGISFIVRVIGRAVKIILSPILVSFGWVYGRIEAGYPGFLSWSLRRRGTVLGASAVMFMITVLLIPKLGIELIPQLSQGEFRIDFRLPPGTPLEKTDAILASLQRKQRGLSQVDTFFSVAGSGNRLDAAPDQGGENWGELSVSMKSGLSSADEEDVTEVMRGDLENSPGLLYKFYRPTLFSFRTPIEVEISGYDLIRLKEVSLDLVERMSDSGRFADVKSTMEQGHPEIQIQFDRDRMASLGLNVYEVARRIVTKVRGEVATRYSWHDRKIDILVRTREEDRSSIEDIRRLIVNPESEHPLDLEGVANIVVGIGPSEIRRVDQERMALVNANLKWGDLGGAAEELHDILNRLDMPSGMSAFISGQNEEMNMSFDSLKFALLLAVFLVYLVMASQFESFLQPFVILFTIPLAFIGAVFALLITGSNISVVVLIGAILLAGIVVNNAIVLIDRINQLRKEGKGRSSAVLEGARSRLRPIVMTMLTTTIGLLPMALGLGEGMEVRAPMAITVIGGLTASTLLTLIVIPVVYSLLDRSE